MNRKVKIFVTVALAFAIICSVITAITTIYVKQDGLSGFAIEAVETATVKQGSRGETVKKIQRKLKNWGYYNGAIDGIFGTQTRNAVIYFQRRNGLTPDGIVGTKTFKALGISTSSVTTTQPSGVGGYSSSDVALLARLIYAEARGETYSGQVAVGAVVLNRVKSSSFPNTISGVIYQPYAFTCVQDGQINLSPNQTAMNAAKDAMNGWDPSYGSLYYYNPAIATSKWIFSRPTTVVIGRHVFAM